MGCPLYAADPAEAVRTVGVEGLTLLYHRRSGMTHILAPPAPQILEVLTQSPGSAAEIAERIAERFDLADADPATAIASRLAELEAAGLVWRP